MKTKSIIFILVFITTFVSSAALTKLLVGNEASFAAPQFALFKKSVDEQTRQKIISLLRQDIKNGREMNCKLYQAKYYENPFTPASLAVYSKAVTEYQAKSASINDRDLPTDFQSVWREHLEAWRDHVAFAEEMKNSAQTGEMSADEIAQEFKDDDNDNDINPTWFEVLDIANDYDANPYN